MNPVLSPCNSLVGMIAMLLALVVSSHSALAQADVDRGAALLSNGDYPAAVSAFEASLETEPTNPRALHGLALAHFRAGNQARARAAFNRAVAPAIQTTRAATLNAAAFFVQIGEPMRSARLLTDWLKAHPEPLDEPLLNALGIALAQTAPGAQRTPAFTLCVRQYLDTNGRLEASRPGLKRWGVQWLPASEVDRRTARREKAARDAERQQATLDDLSARLAVAQRDLIKKADLHRRGWVTQSELMAVQQEVRDLTDGIERRQRERQQALDASAPPTFPPSIAFVALDDNTPTMDSTTIQTPADPEPRDGDGRSPWRITRKPTQPADSTGSQPPQTPSDTDAPEDENQTTLNDPPQEPPVRDEQPQPPADRPSRSSRTVASVAVPVAPDLLLCSAVINADGTNLSVVAADGTPLKVTIVRTDPNLGLTLLRSTDKKLNYFGLGDTFSGGQLTCLALLRESIFQPAPKTLSGSSAQPGPGWTVRLDQHPRLPGAPLLADGRLVGIALPRLNSPAGAIPAVSAPLIRRFLAEDAPTRSPAIQGDASNLIYQVSSVAAHPSIGR